MSNVLMDEEFKKCHKMEMTKHENMKKYTINSCKRHKIPHANYIFPHTQRVRNYSL
jgi:hypothetical protein